MFKLEGRWLLQAHNQNGMRARLLHFKRQC